MRSKYIQITSAGAGTIYNIDGSDSGTATIIAVGGNDAGVGVPSWAKTAVVIPENVNWRVRSDAINPSASVGEPLFTELGHKISVRVIEDWKLYKFTQSTGSNAVLNITFYEGQPDQYGKSVFVN